MEVTVEKNLRVFVMSQIFKQKDFSISDAYFYINKITSHVSFFYSALTNFFNFLLQSSVYFFYLLFTNPPIIITFSVGIIILKKKKKKLLVSSKNYMHKTFLFEKIHVWKKTQYEHNNRSYWVFIHKHVFLGLIIAFQDTKTLCSREFQGP